MRKGTTALRNIQMLKWSKEHGVAADWNILYGFPGETQQDYDEMLSLFPAIRFLQVEKESQNGNAHINRA